MRNSRQLRAFLIRDGAASEAVAWKEPLIGLSFSAEGESSVWKWFWSCEVLSRWKLLSVTACNASLRCVLFCVSVRNDEARSANN
jgi:hypothetical protein